ncbi:NAD(P)H-dependent oxidoreductase [Arthrobacter bussei]|jgi:NAD(P)H-dependent FMN reductase|uniref:NAD(P)H-dependent oxidoreductase n=1 Tax=Arthrobacter bussei TaxID=2594179 RepID=A0A7X1NPA7_9MICC|nr:NADPH-dependent FMN reductase [Arthrobacter bussei]MPY10425.1 NAD(P)H-dependent oxidoreductase [Arthrobacter bussei]
MTTTILTLVGSLREGSINRQLAEAAKEHAPEAVNVVTFDRLSEVPFYNEDIDNDADRPKSADDLRAAAADADALLLVSPEYNGTMPAVLKNAIDWLSRPYGAGAISSKPAAVIGSAFGQYGGVWAHDEARRALGVAGASVVDDTKLSIGGSITRFAEVHPKDDAEVAGQVSDVLSALAGAASPVAA